MTEIGLELHEVICVDEGQLEGRVSELILAFDVFDHVRVVLVKTRYDHLVKVDRNDITIPKGVPQMTIVERRRAGQFDRVITLAIGLDLQHIE